MDKSLTLRQVMMTYLLITISPVIRDIPNIAAKISGSISYASVIISLIMLLGLMLVVYRIIQKYTGMNIYDIIENSAGNVAAKIIAALYALWALISAGSYMQYYVMRFNSTIMPYTNPGFFIGVMLVLAFLAFRKSFKTVCRISEICFPVITVILAILVLLALPVVNVQNLAPKDIRIMPLICTGADIGAVGGYLVLVLFLGDRISKPWDFRKTAIWSSLYFAAVTVIIIAVTVGINGAELTARLPLPFFTTVKQISSFGVVERVEPLLISVWLLTDFVVISTFTAIFLLCIKWVLGLERVSFLMIPSLAVIYYFTKLFAGSQFELEYYTENIMPALNIIFQYVIPIIIFVLCRKKSEQM